MKITDRTHRLPPPTKCRRISSTLANRIWRESVQNDLKHTSVANLNIDTSFVDIGALRVKVLIFKEQICLHLQTRAVTFWPKQMFEARWIKSTKFEARWENLKTTKQMRFTKYNLCVTYYQGSYKIIFIYLQYQQFSLHIYHSSAKLFP